MATLIPGVLLKLLECMNSGAKLTSEYRNSVLQVIDIMPVDLDEKDLIPKQGFYLKVSDSIHSVYVSLESEKDDLVLSNKIQVGQFIHVEKLEVGLKFPVLKGVKPINGRHLFVGMPEPIIGFLEKGEKKEEKGNVDSKLLVSRRGSWDPIPVKIKSTVNLNSKLEFLASRRSSWVTGQKGEDASKPIPLKVDHRTPVKDRSSMISFRSVEKMSSNRRASSSKLNESPVIVKKSGVTSSTVMIPKSKSRICDKSGKTLKGRFNSADKKSVTPPSSWSTQVMSSPITRLNMKEHLNTKISSPLKSPYANSSSETRLSFNFPRKLSLLGKEAVQQQEIAQKIALQALRNVSATETLVCSIKALSTLSKSANPNDPIDCFDQFLEFHNQIAQSIADMVSIKSATESTNKEEKNTQILPEIINNTTPGKGQQKSTILGKHSRSSSDNQKGKMGSLNDTIKLGKEIEKESGNWFMDFLEKYLENATKKSKSDGTKVPQSLIMKILKWVEVEQFDSSKKPMHPKAIEIARKLRIKLKNPLIFV